MSNILSILHNPNQLLRQKGKEVDLESLSDKSFQDFIEDMIATMWQADGVGLAAPQIGKSLRIIVIASGKQASVLINPKIIYKSLRKEVMEEGCLSVPGLFGPVKRSRMIRCRAYTRDGKKVSFKAEGLTARIIQHEVDHLNGILFIDRAKWVASVGTSAEL